MRLLPILALSGAAVAQEGMMDKLTAWATNFKLQIVNTLPFDAGVSALAGSLVQPMTMNNWQTHLWPKEHEPEEWLVYMTGRNKSCFGRCEHADRTWNKSVPILAALPSGPNKPTLRLGSISCEDNEILCTAWSVGVPSIWHFLPNATNGKTTSVRMMRLNTTSVTVENITSIPLASTSRFRNFDPYEGIMHPIDGMLQKLHLMIPFGYLLWILGAVPSWAMMLVISFFSRQIMNKRLNEGPAGLPAGQAPAGRAAAQPQPQAAAGAGGKSPAGKGGKKKR